MNYSDVVLCRCIIVVTCIFCLGMLVAFGCTEFVFLSDDEKMDGMIRKTAIDLICSRNKLACISVKM